MNKSIIEFNDGYKTNLYKWEVKNPKAVVQLLHGAREHAVRYNEFATYLNKLGIEVWAMDLRGHGSKAEEQRSLGHIGSKASWRILLDDVDMLTDLIRNDFPKAKYMLFGHSLGAFLGRTYAQFFRKADMYVFSGSVPNVQYPWPFARMLLQTRLMLRGRKRFLTIKNNKDHNDIAKKMKEVKGIWLSSERDFERDAKKDPYLNLPYTNESYLAILDLMIRQEKHINLHDRKPTLFLGGARDVLGVRGKKLAKSFKEYKNFNPKTYVQIFNALKYEVITQDKREAVYKFIAEFIMNEGKKIKNSDLEAATKYFKDDLEG